MSKHTPGPWIFDLFKDYEDGTDKTVVDPRGFIIATVEGSPLLNRWDEKFPKMSHWSMGADNGSTMINRSQSELDANARLIAAAPDLLEVMERALRLSREHPDEFKLYAMEPFEAAIAKAKGEA